MHDSTRPAGRREEHTTLAVRAAYQAVIHAGAHLEEALQVDTPPAAYADMTTAQQLDHAAHTLLQLRGMTDRADVAWYINAPQRTGTDPVELCGSIYKWDLPANTTTRGEAAQWAALLGAEIVEETRPSGTVLLTLQGVYAEVPVELTAYLPVREREAVGGAR